VRKFSGFPGSGRKTQQNTAKNVIDPGKAAI
jgi:hypothetical protein